jgi:hypothetical protein
MEMNIDTKLYGAEIFTVIATISRRMDIACMLILWRNGEMEILLMPQA